MTFLRRGSWVLEMGRDGVATGTVPSGVPVTWFRVLEIEDTRIDVPETWLRVLEMGDLSGFGNRGEEMVLWLITFIRWRIQGRFCTTLMWEERVCIGADGERW